MAYVRASLASPSVGPPTPDDVATVDRCICVYQDLSKKWRGLIFTRSADPIWLRHVPIRHVSGDHVRMRGNRSTFIKTRHPLTLLMHRSTVHDYGYMNHNPRQGCPTPVVLVECWQAEDGSFALVAASIEKFYAAFLKSSMHLSKVRYISQKGA